MIVTQIKYKPSADSMSRKYLSDLELPVGNHNKEFELFCPTNNGRLGFMIDSSPSKRIYQAFNCNNMAPGSNYFSPTVIYIGISG